MYLGILISDLMPKGIEEGMKLAKDMGYTHIELGAYDIEGTGDRPGISGTFTKSDAEQVAELARSFELTISSFQCHVGYIFKNREDWDLRVEHTKKMVELADHIGVKVVHTVSGMAPEGLDESLAWGQLLHAYEHILEYANNTKVKVAIEPVFVYLVGNYATTKTLFDKLRREDLYINFDPSHFPYHRESPIPFIKDFGTKIIHAHVKDAQVGPINPEEITKHISFDMGGGKQFKFVPPGKGVLNWQEILSALKEIGYDDVLSLELGHGMEEPEKLAQENIAFFKELLKA